MQKLVTLLLLVLASSSLGAASLQVAATTPNMGMLALTVGGEHVNVRVMSPGDRDTHYLEARPSMMAALRRADLLVAVGGELEIGWLPAALQGANNGRVLPGRPGYFEGAAFVELLDAGQVADRSHGDVHPEGNPHFYMDPLRMVQVARALAQRMAELDRANAATFSANAEAFAAEVETRMASWRARTESASDVVLYHSDGDYLMRRFGITILGYIEPLPGIPPTARHLRGLVGELRQYDHGVVIHQVFQPDQGPRFLSRELGWPVHRLRSEVQPNDRAPAYFAMIDSWIQVLERE